MPTSATQGAPVSPIPIDAHVSLAPALRLQWEAAQECHVLLYPEGMVQLNPSAAAILELCDGVHTFRDIVGTLTARFPEASNLSDDVAEFIDVASHRGWVRVR